jgi:hypothetical protein
MAQENSLTDRLYDDPVYEQLIRLIGYDGMELQKYEETKVVLFKKHGTRRAGQAIRDLVRTDCSVKPIRICLRAEIRSRVWPILGPDPQYPPWWTKKEEELFTKSTKTQKKKRGK